MHLLDFILESVNTTKNPKPLTWFQFFFGIYRKCRLYLLRNYQSPKFILSAVGILSTLYIFTPSLKSENRNKISKRPDKYTIGFTNKGVDCFANSIIQSLSALQELNDYFTDILKYQLPDDAPKYPLPMHTSIMYTINILQKTVYKSETISVWDSVLKMLENVRGLKISRYQHDAHELLNILLETLELEYNQYFSFIKKLEDDTKIKILNTIPKFPFNLSTESKFKCLTCGSESKKRTNSLMMFELTVPQKNTNLQNLIKDSLADMIDDYVCYICTIKQLCILPPTRLKLDDEQQKFLDLMKSYLINGNLYINDDYCDDPIFLSILKTNGIEKIKSQVYRISEFVQIPKIIPIHLSRSIYQDMQSWRNSSSVDIPNTITIQNNQYKLKSIVRHKGVHSSGHYECFKRKPQFYKDRETGEYFDDMRKIGDEHNIIDFKRGKKLASVMNKPFWRISDNVVTEVSLDYVLNDGKAVYILFYELIK